MSNERLIKLAHNNNRIVKKAENNIFTKKKETYLKYFMREVENENVPNNIQEKLISYFDEIWEVYVENYSNYKFVSSDFMVRKLIQNIGELKYLSYYTKKVIDLDTLSIFEELWEKICNILGMTVY